MRRRLYLLVALCLAAPVVSGQTATPVNPHGASVGPCATCHTAVGWRPARISRQFEHAPRTFPLEGAHASTPCRGCHASLDFSQAKPACAQCHRDVHNAEMGSDCAQCHTTRSFDDESALRRQHELTRFPLRGAHATLACASCHPPVAPGQSQYRRRPTECMGCHAATYRTARAPDHQAAGFPQDCTLCHSTSRWGGGRFDHATTKFALTGAHASAACSQCHGDGVYRGKSTACVGCHQADYAQANSPPHAASGFSTACATCHTVKAWAGAGFDHAGTAFPLTGAHRAAPCARCHGDGVFRGKSSACATCHLAAYNATATPPHAASGFPTTCAQCHGTASWLGSSFDHGATAFPLTGAHRASACAACHHNNVFKGTPKECVSCHQAAYDASKNPPHRALALPTVCFQCHTTTAWAGGTFDHAVTRFALTGAHRAVSCNGCHADGIYRGKVMACAGCHQGRFDATTNPNHRTAAFPATCENCHGTAAWTPSTFNHANTGFPLTGAHVAARCASCHADGVFRGKTTVCSGCHLAQYNATTNPNHTAASFPTACESCHTTTRWQGATFNHDASFFPIYSGAHKGRWSTCADCHTVATNYAIFSCFSCHRQADMDAKHRGRTGYRYDSALCYQCHPAGRAG
ncbi:MAG: multiheme c-type cytochrome [Gemmatimonadaceae bacterium]